MAAGSKLPSWQDMATSIAQMYVESIQRAQSADAAGEKREAGELRKTAGRAKKLMDKYGITIRSNS